MFKRWDDLTHCLPVCQPPRGHRDVSPHPPSMRSCSFWVTRALCKVIEQARVAGRTGCSLTPLLSHVGGCPGFSTESPVSWETSGSLRIGIVVCPAKEEPRISFSYGTIQSSILSQNEAVAQSFKMCPLKTYTKTLCVENHSFLQKMKASLCRRHTAAARSLPSGRLCPLGGGRFRLLQHLTSNQS